MVEEMIEKRRKRDQVCRDAGNIVGYRDWPSHEARSSDRQRTPLTMVAPISCPAP